mmetsp:Transcript_46521/g.140949  ORF Transcript_46521/g.140949 Transcript_46521/m.140949 type:complete len:298 (+) Transcript_46521:563-1456(+)
MRGIISTDTLRLCHKLRSSHGSKLVLVSGMRTTTLLKRLPFLPRADAYASEAGSRVFYPVNLAKEASYQGTIIRPERYDGVSDSDLASFGIKEDMEWRAKMELRNAAGGDGYVQRDRDVDVLSRRSGLLWDHARRLESKGFVIDFHGYAACFRVNRKQQKEDQTKGEAFDALLKSSPPEGLACSVNLGCIDFYPEASGKKNCCAYLAHKFASGADETMVKTSHDLLGEYAVCICDDDNDLEMALACSRAYLPSVTSESMAEAAKENPKQIYITQNKEEGIVGVTATEKALRIILGEA